MEDMKRIKRSRDLRYSLEQVETGIFRHKQQNSREEKNTKHRNFMEWNKRKNILENKNSNIFDPTKTRIRYIQSSIYINI